MEEKSNKKIILLLVILIILVSALIVLVVYKGFFAEKIEIKGDSSTITTTTNIKNDLSNIEKEWENEKNIIYNDVINMLDEFIRKEFHQYDIKFDYNYMDDIVARNNIVISAMMGNKKIKKEFDVSVNGEEYTGSISFDKNDFINTYNIIVGEQPNFNKIINATENFSKNVEIKDDKIFGSYVTGSALYMIKLNEIVCSNTEYSVKLDYVYETDENSDIIINEYDNYEKTKTFDSSLVNALININLNKNSDGTYKINYLSVTKNN